MPWSFAKNRELFISSLTSYSLEQFITEEEIKSIDARIKALKSQIPPQEQNALTQTSSMHSLDQHNVNSTAKIYSPEGRIEIPISCEFITKILSIAFMNKLPDISRVYFSAKQLSPWTYVEYHEKQYITPHIDLPFNEINPGHPKLAAITVSLNEDYIGGEFYVETCGKSDLWQNSIEGSLPQLKKDCASHALWFVKLPKTRWKVKPVRGTAVIFGSQLIHGTEPVLEGMARKLISFITV